MADRKDHRAALLEAAIQCLEELGYARTTTRDIVAAAGSHLPSINYYFGSKESLLDEAIAECCRRWLSSATKLAAEVSGRERGQPLDMLCSRLFELLEEKRPLMVAFVESLAQAERSEPLRRQLGEQYDEYRHTVARIVGSMLPASPAPAEAELTGLASLLIAVADGLMIQSLLDPDRTAAGDELLRSLRTVTRAVLATR